MSTHVVIANDGFISRAMSPFEAYKYGRMLKELGNYDIWITEASHAAEFKNRRNTANVE